MTNLLDMLTTVIFIAVPTLVGTGVMVAVVGWSVGLYKKILTAQTEIEQVRANAVYDAAIKQLDLQRQGATVDLIQPDHNGLLPLPRAALDTYPRQLITLASQYIDSRKALPVMPQTLTYSPHINNAKADSKALEMAELSQLMAPEPQPTPDLWKLYHQDALPNDGFLLGMDLETGEPVTATWKNLYSCLVGGVSGSGKSTLVRCLTAQAALQGARFVVCDPHLDAGEESLGHSLRPLERLLHMPMAGDDESIKTALQYVNAVVDRRLKDNGADREPLVLIVDELTGIYARGTIADEMTYTLGLLVRESRKVGVYAIGCGQMFLAEQFPTTVRNSFASFISCRNRRDMAKVQSGSNIFGKAAEELTIGQAAYMNTAGELRKLSVPNTTAKHLELVAKSLGNGCHAVSPEPLHLPLHSPLPSSTETSGHETNAGGDGSGHGSGDGSGSHTSNPELIADPARLALVRQLIKSGKSRGQILADVWGISKAGGNAWKQAAEQLDDIIRHLIN